MGARADRLPRLAALSLTLGLLLVTTGCIALPVEDQELWTAHQALQAASVRGEAWAEDAQPVRLSTIGQPNPSQTGDRGKGQVTLDGRAHVWLVTLWSPGRQAGLTMVLTSTGEATTTPTDEAPNTTRSLKIDQLLDSPTILQNALNDSSFQTISSAQDATLSLDLADEDGRPAWTVMAFSRDTQATRILTIDAETGTTTGQGP